ncbi:MAG: prephenate dehydrogenase [Ferruginibacter sp.]|nr:prephenate dehydrogenase [Ferruginibacter sp.]
MIQNVTIIGIGLIGGSFALALKEKNIAKNIIGVDNNEENIEKAKTLGLINEALTLEEAIQKSNLIFVAIPVDATISVMAKIMPLITKNQIVVDAGSTKFDLCKMVKQYKNGNRFVATHPMWGTEHSGPQAAVNGAFEGKACVICNKENSAKDALETIENIYKKLGMHLVYMNAEAHDVHAAYISHISHITSFALANTVLQKEKEDDAIFELASGGFESTVRLAKSNAAMWVPIFKQNKENVLDVLNEHIVQLRKFKSCLEKENYEYLYELIDDANKIKRIIK